MLLKSSKKYAWDRCQGNAPGTNTTASHITRIAHGWAYPVSQIFSMVRGSKTAQLLRGVTMYLAVNNESDPSVVFGSVRDALWRLAQATCTTYRHVKTLSCPNATDGWGLGYDQYPAAFKPTAVRINLPQQWPYIHLAPTREHWPFVEPTRLTNQEVRKSLNPPPRILPDSSQLDASRPASSTELTRSPFR